MNVMSGFCAARPGQRDRSVGRGEEEEAYGVSVRVVDPSVTNWHPRGRLLRREGTEEGTPRGEGMKPPPFF